MSDKPNKKGTSIITVCDALIAPADVLRLEVKHNKKKSSVDIDWIPTKHRWRAASVSWKVTSTESQQVQIKLNRGDRTLGYLEVPISHFFSSTHKWFSFPEKKDNLKVSPGAKALQVRPGLRPGSLK